MRKRSSRSKTSSSRGANLLPSKRQIVSFDKDAGASAVSMAEPKACDIVPNNPFDIYLAPGKQSHFGGTFTVRPNMSIEELDSAIDLFGGPDFFHGAFLNIAFNIKK
jgi:hypothetical protein